MTTDNCPKCEMRVAANLHGNATQYDCGTIITKTGLTQLQSHICAELTRLRAENAGLRERMAGAYAEMLEARAHLSKVYDKSKFDADQAILRAIEELEPTEESEGE